MLVAIIGGGYQRNIMNLKEMAFWQGLSLFVSKMAFFQAE